MDGKWVWGKNVAPLWFLSMATFYLTLIKTSANRSRNVHDTLPDLYNPHNKFVCWQLLTQGQMRGRGQEGKGEDNASWSKLRQLKFHPGGTNTRKNFHKTNNLELRNLDTASEVKVLKIQIGKVLGMISFGTSLKNWNQMLHSQAASKQFQISTVIIHL